MHGFIHRYFQSEHFVDELGLKLSHTLSEPTRNNNVKHNSVLLFMYLTIVLDPKSKVT